MEDPHKVIAVLWDELIKLIAIVEAQALRIAKLEEKLNADSGNSSKPPSQDRMKGGTSKEKRQSSGRKKGAAAGSCPPHARAAAGERAGCHSVLLPPASATSRPLHC
ncbi:DUF6444 domain-containing protein [Candidatus Methylospira mobilis]|nr:DUF6444 domain-containing protein [Candidatus Methylospira mobilis]WNV06897.1 DUF6444 domain-containing protein [Candidatus Methylospira mobilis]